MCEVLQKSQQDSFLLQFLSLSYSYLLTREFDLNIQSVPIFLTDRKASLKAKPDDLIDFPNWKEKQGLVEILGLWCSALASIQTK